MKFLDRYADQAYALLRIVAGLMFLKPRIAEVFRLPGSVPDGAQPAVDRWQG